MEWIFVGGAIIYGNRSHERGFTKKGKLFWFSHRRICRMDGLCRNWALNKIPVYAKDELSQWWSFNAVRRQKQVKRLILKSAFTETKPMKHMLYDDDGESFNPWKGEYSFREIKKVDKTMQDFTEQFHKHQQAKPNTIKQCDGGDRAEGG